MLRSQARQIAIAPVNAGPTSSMTRNWRAAGYFRALHDTSLDRNVTVPARPIE